MEKQIFSQFLISCCTHFHARLSICIVKAKTKLSYASTTIEILFLIRSLILSKIEKILFNLKLNHKRRDLVLN